MRLWRQCDVIQLDLHNVCKSVVRLRLTGSCPHYTFCTAVHGRTNLAYFVTRIYDSYIRTVMGTDYCTLDGFRNTLWSCFLQYNTILSYMSCSFRHNSPASQQTGRQDDDIALAYALLSKTAVPLSIRRAYRRTSHHVATLGPNIVTNSQKKGDKCTYFIVQLDSTLEFGRTPSIE